ncbi:peptide/nickel transport system permease protein/nickel transport system permease protein [Murinocardiopsis flavida]|uniref:Peptide/nickel transport system permease protein/nickel transport system permease protein n=1 Tax=Murinocardiopsis flavida TaxID=645275 RepID=A0A2P8DQS5_9ACTN|nr:ABC transporter permease [Murinocardiopsis flavida]PSK99573.1 peptide/nickel transport system permease protein/nickel transport system permease protein [Murinocardiopsis flavida]
MAIFALRRAGAALLVVAALSVGSFVLLELAPGDPARAVLEARSGGRPVPEAAVREQRAAMGVDAPLPARYASWVGGLVRGDLGLSYASGRPVADEIAAALPWTLLLTGAALVLACGGAIALGLTAGLTRSTALRRCIELAMFALGGLPGFVGALALLFVFSVWLGWLPSGGLGRPGADPAPGDVLRALVLPAAALAFGHHFGVYVRLVQTGVARVRDSVHVAAAEARGLPAWRVRTRHILRPGLVPFAARFGAGAAHLIAGAYTVELVFAWPGMGRLALDAARGHDLPVLVAVVMVTGGLIVLATFAGEVATARLDPRIHLGGKG